MSVVGKGRGQEREGLGLKTAKTKLEVIKSLTISKWPASEEVAGQGAAVGAEAGQAMGGEAEHIGTGVSTHLISTLGISFYCHSYRYRYFS